MEREKESKGKRKLIWKEKWKAKGGEKRKPREKVINLEIEEESKCKRKRKLIEVIGNGKEKGKQMKKGSKDKNKLERTWKVKDIEKEK